MSSSNLDHLITLGGRREGRPARATSSLYDEKGSLPNSEFSVGSHLSKTDTNLLDIEINLI